MNLPRSLGSLHLTGRVLCVIVVCAAAAGMTGLAANFPVSSKSLAVVRTCVLTATPSTTAVVIDADVQQTLGLVNSGTATTMNVSSMTAANQRVYIMFTLTSCSPAVAATASVKSATLRLYTSGIPSACRTHNIFRVTASWTETGITWNSQPFGTSLNNPPQGQRTASMDIGSGTCANNAANQYVSGWDVTTDVASFVAGSATNYGWMIRDDVENGGLIARTATYSTKNLGNAGQAPQLVVNYIP